MALIECHECEGQLSTLAIACPHCGAPGPSKPEQPPAGISPPEEVAPVAAASEVAPCIACGYVDIGEEDPEVLKQIAQRRLASFIARSFLIIGGIVAVPVFLTQGELAAIVYLGQFLLLGLGLAITAFGLDRMARQASAKGIAIGGAMYSTIVLSAIISANLSRLGG